MFFKKNNISKIVSETGKVSFSQSGEDMIVDFIFKVLLKIEKPTYIDIGAYDPFTISNTARLFLNGSRGVNIDPNPKAIEKFNKYRQSDVNLNIGVSDLHAELEYYMFTGPEMNTFSEEEMLKNKDQLIDTIKIRVLTINEIVNKYCKGIFPDFLSLDVEGLDLKILKGIDFDNNAPKVICVETISNEGNGSWSKCYDTINFLKSKNYLHHSETCINSIFIRQSALKNFSIKL